MSKFQQNTKIWQPPLELQRSTPREVQLTPGGKAVAILAVALLIGAFACTVLLARKANRESSLWKSWQAEAVETQGEVTGLRITGSGDNRRYWVDYQYRSGEQNFAGSARLRREGWRRLKQGNAITVSYRRSEPGQSWITGREPTGTPLAVAYLVGVALLAPVPFLVYAVRRQRRLLEEGRAALARVIATKKVSSQHGSHYSVEYEFETMSGTRRSGKFSAQRKSPEIGEHLIVLYHPDEEKWSAKYPLCLVRVAGSE